MTNFSGHPFIDLSVFLIANVVNLFMTGVFLARTKGYILIEYVLGLLVVAVALPVILIMILNIIHHRNIWMVVLLLPIVMFCLIELLLDYILGLDFRNTGFIWIYIVIFYLGIWGLIGYSFLIGRVYGFITLFTYFISLWSTWYAHSQ